MNDPIARLAAPSTRAPARPVDPRHSQRGGAATWLLVILLLGGVAFAVYWFALRGGSGSASSALASAVIPADADTIIGLDVGAIVNDATFVQLAKARGFDIDKIKAKVAESGIKVEDVRSIVVAIDQPDAGAPEVLVAVEVNADTKAAQGAVLALKSMLPEEAAQRLDLSKVEAFPNGLVLAGSGDLYEKAATLARGQGSAGALSAALIETRDAVDAGAPIWFATTLPEKALGRMGGMAKKILGDAKPTHAGFSARLGATMQLKGAVRFEGGSASKIADQIGAALGFATLGVDKDIGEILKTLDIGSTGNTLTVSAAVTEAQVKSVGKMFLF